MHFKYLKMHFIKIADPVQHIFPVKRRAAAGREHILLLLIAGHLLSHSALDPPAQNCVKVAGIVQQRSVMILDHAAADGKDLIGGFHGRNHLLHHVGIALRIVVQKQNIGSRAHADAHVDTACKSKIAAHHSHLHLWEVFSDIFHASIGRRIINDQRLIVVIVLLLNGFKALF